MVLKFDNHVLDIERRELRRGVESIALEPQVFDLLVYLVRNRDRVVSKDDLIDAVWGGRIVSDSALTTRLNAARKAVNDNGAAQQTTGDRQVTQLLLDIPQFSITASQFRMLGVENVHFDGDGPAQQLAGFRQVARSFSIEPRLK